MDSNDIMDELLAYIFVTSAAPVRRSRVIRRLYPIMMVNKRFHRICKSSIMMRYIVPKAILLTHGDLNPHDIIEQYHHPKFDHRSQAGE